MTTMLSGPTSPSFARPEYHLAGADTATIGAIIATASDIALVVDAQGVVQDFAVGAEGLDHELLAGWSGQSVESIVTTESRTKIRDMIAAARRGEAPRWREVNHPMGEGRDDLPVRYCAVQADSEGHVMLLGRDLRAVAALQRRLVSAQQSLERDYARLLQMETRYRLLFQSATEAFLIIDSATNRILEMNRAAQALLGLSEQDAGRRKFPTGLAPAGAQALDSAMAAVRSSGRAESVSVHTAEGAQELDAVVSLFRAEGSKLFLVRLTGRQAAGGHSRGPEAQVVELFRRACEAIVLTDAEGRIEWANDAFLDLVQAAVESQVQDENIDRFFTREGIDLPLILANTRENGRLRYYSTSVTGLHGTTTEVEVSTVALPHDGGTGYGFVFRNAAYRPQETQIGGPQLPRSAEQLTELIGRVPMKDLVRETVDVIERMCIEAALQMTDDNRASAADLLGLSRQSLYVKLRRYGLGDGESGGNGQDKG